MNTIKLWLADIIGTYTPDYTASGMAQIDFQWILSAVLLIVLILYFFKALAFVLGGLCKK